MERLIAIVGPTGAGKSHLALHLTKVFPGEIVSADSRQVYRYLNVGTAKLGAPELSQVPHHLINIINPDEDFSLAQYQALAYQAIKDIQKHHKLPFLVGGSGQYIWAVLEGWQIPKVLPNPKLRYNLEKRARDSGIDEVYQELMRIDPEAAQQIDRRNVRRVVRALEVHWKTSKPFSRLKDKVTPPFDTFIIGLTLERDELYRRIDQRVDKMIEHGLVDETANLLNMGYDFSLPAMSGIGYRQIGLFLRGELSLADAKQQIKSETHRFVRHQYAWFRLKDERIHWFDRQKQGDAEIERTVANFMGRN